MSAAQADIQTYKGCGRCADLLAAYWLTGDAGLFEQLRDHVTNHQPGKSIHSEVNRVARLDGAE